MFSLVPMTFSKVTVLEFLAEINVLL